MVFQVRALSDSDFTSACFPVAAHPGNEAPMPPSLLLFCAILSIPLPTLSCWQLHAFPNCQNTLAVGSFQVTPEVNPSVPVATEGFAT